MASSQLPVRRQSCVEEITRSPDTRLNRANTEGSGLKVATTFKESVPPNLLQNLTPQEIKRQQVIFEICNTEKQYINDLKLTVRYYLNPIRQKNLLAKHEIGALFGNLESIIPINNEISMEITKRRNTFGPIMEKISDIFLKRVDLFKIYAGYCSSNRKSSEKLQEFREQYPEFNTFLNSVSSKKVMRGLRLEDFLVLPMQRVCRYPLLFKSLLKETPEDHRDYQDTLEFHKHVIGTVKLIDDRTKQVEIVEKLSFVQKKYSLSDLGIDIVERGRSVEEEKQVSISRTGKKLKEPGVIILLNDELIVLKSINEVYSLLCRIPITLVTMRETEGLIINITFGRKQYDIEFASREEQTQFDKSYRTVFRKQSRGIVQVTRKSSNSTGRQGGNSIKKKIFNSISKRNQRKLTVNSNVTQSEVSVHPEFQLPPDPKRLSVKEIFSITPSSEPDLQPLPENIPIVKSSTTNDVSTLISAVSFKKPVSFETSNLNIRKEEDDNLSVPHSNKNERSVKIISPGRNDEPKENVPKVGFSTEPIIQKLDKPKVQFDKKKEKEDSSLSEESETPDNSEEKSITINYEVSSESPPIVQEKMKSVIKQLDSISSTEDKINKLLSLLEESYVNSHLPSPKNIPTRTMPKLSTSNSGPIRFQPKKKSPRTSRSPRRNRKQNSDTPDKEKSERKPTRITVTQSSTDILRYSAPELDTEPNVEPYGRVARIAEQFGGSKRTSRRMSSELSTEIESLRGLISTAQRLITAQDVAGAQNILRNVDSPEIRRTVREQAKLFETIAAMKKD